jgi:DNA-directed RNA polymerase subunit E'/Rpb7
MISTQSTTHTGLATKTKRTNVRRILKIVSPSENNNVPIPVNIPPPEPYKSIATTPVKEKQENTDYCDPTLFSQKKIERSITVPFHKIARSTNISEVLKREMSAMLEGKCSIEGYICPGSIIIIQHSCGRLNGGNVIFDVTMSCLICLPNEQEKISCVVKTITQAGIRAVAKGLKPGSISPIEVFLSRDMNMNVKHITEYFMRVKESDTIVVEIIGRRFVLNDTHVTIIGILSNK